jgi:hypothetical protein
MLRTITIATATLLLGCKAGNPKAPPTTVPAYAWVTVPAGWYTSGCVGSLADRVEDRLTCARTSPPGRVWLSSYEIARYPASRQDLARCVAAGACADSGSPEDFQKRWDPNGTTAQAVTHAVAEQYCRWRGGRLPTHHEWEKAARGTEERIYPWGNTLPTCDQVRADQYPSCEFVRPVGAFPASASQWGVEQIVDAPEWIWSPKPAWFGAPDREQKPTVLAMWKLVFDSTWHARRVQLPDVVVRDVTHMPPMPGVTSDSQPWMVDLERTRVEPRSTRIVDPGLADLQTRAAVFTTTSMRDHEIGTVLMPSDDESADATALVRCARSVSGPPAPVVPDLKPEVQPMFDERKVGR